MFDESCSKRAPVKASGLSARSAGMNMSRSGEPARREVALDIDPVRRRLYPQEAYVVPPSAVEILLVRHGTAAPYDPSSPHALVEGRADPALCVEGEHQAVQLAKRLAHERIDAIYVTPLRRTVQTAAPLAARLDIVPVVVPDLIEVQLGEWERGVIRQRVAERHPVVAEMVRAERWDVIPGAETNESLRARVSRGLHEIYERHVGGRVLAVVHDGVIGAALSIATGATPFSFHGSANGSISSLVIDGDNWRLRRFNDTAHQEVARYGS